MLFTAQTALAQHESINFINFSNKEGLSANSITAIVKDRYGYMWFGTEDGLNKFDGEKFTVYRHKQSDSTSIAANKILSLCEDKQGNLWIGTSSGLSLYNRRKDAFTQFSFDGIGPAVRALCADHFGNLWIGGYTGLCMLEAGTGKMVNYTTLPGSDSMPAPNMILFIYEDSRHRLWAGTKGGLLFFDRGKHHFHQYVHEAVNPLSIPENTIRSIAEDKNGTVWFGTDDGGLVQLLADGKGFKTYRSIPSNTATLSSNRVYAIAPDANGALWIGTENGLNIFDPTSGKAVRVESDYRNQYSLTDKSIRSIYIDSDGAYWIGGFRTGVSKYDKKLVFFNLRQSNPFDKKSLSARVVTAFAEGDDGNIYVGTDGGGLNLYQKKTGLFSHIASLPEEALTVLAMERMNSELWVAVYRQGIYVLDLRSGAVIRHYTKGEDERHLLSNDIYRLKKDRNGNMWIGSNGDGVNVYDSRKGTFRKFTKSHLTGEDELSLNGFIRTFEEDHNGNMWIGSYGSGIAVLSLSGKELKVYRQGTSLLPDYHISDIVTDSKGVVWVGTSGGGICRLERDGTFTVFSEKEGLSNAVIHKILEDSTGRLWLSHNKGISSFDRHTGKFKNYSSRNGLQKSSFSPGAGLLTSNGELFFGGLDGFNFINPYTIRPNTNVPAVVFTDLKISNRSVAPGSDEVIKEHISVAKEITLDYKQNFSLDFVALNYTAPGENRYSYMLEGFEKDWNNVGTSTKAVYTNLDPGHYTFRLKATSDDGSWVSPEASIKIYVKPPFWRTFYAYILYVVFAAGLLAAWRYWEVGRLRNKFAQEQERLRFQQMLEQERKEAEQKHELDQVKIKFLTNLSHEFRTPISLIVGPAEQLLQQETNEHRAGQLSLIKRNARRLLNLVNQLLDFRKLEENELKLNLTDGDLVDFVKEVGDSFKDISQRRHIHFAFTSAVPHYYTSFDRDKIERMVFNLLSNAFKFTKADGEIGLKIEQNFDRGVKIIVSDTGIGMSPETLEKVFERFYQDDTHPGIMNQGSGIGLSITKEFVKLHGGVIEVESIQGKGSVFTIQLPCMAIADPAVETWPVSAENDIARSTGKRAPEQEKPVVLLVDDHEDFLNYLSDNLVSHYKIIKAADGRQGWQKALSAHPQVVVSDISMPYMDGIALCQKIKSDQRTRHIPVVLLTALTGEANHIKGLQTGAADYLSKPFNFEILNVKIKNLLNQSRYLEKTYSRHIKIDTPQTEVQSDDEKLMLSITQYIDNNIDNPELTVEELSRHVFMSRSTLYNKIVALTGETPVEFIRSFRLNKAADLLKSPTIKVAHAGYAVGFTSPNYFARAFKAKFNISPSDYAKRWSNEGKTNAG